MKLIPVTPTHADGVREWINPDHVSRVETISATPSRAAHTVIHFGSGQLGLAVLEDPAVIARMANGEPRAAEPAVSGAAGWVVSDLIVGAEYAATDKETGKTYIVTIEKAQGRGMIAYRPEDALRAYEMPLHIAEGYTWTRR